MTIPVSIAKAAKAALLTALQAAITEPDGTQDLTVCYDDPSTFLAADIVSVGEVHRTPAALGMVGSMGPLAMSDEVVIDVVVSVYRGGDYAQTVAERGFDLVDAVVAVIRTDPTISGTVLRSIVMPFDYGKADWIDDRKGRLSTTTVPIRCMALN